MTPLYGRALRGKRVVDNVSHGHWKTTTFITTLRCDGLRAPMVIDGAIIGELFLAYLEQVLVWRHYGKDWENSAMCFYRKNAKTTLNTPDTKKERKTPY